MHPRRPRRPQEAHLHASDCLLSGADSVMLGPWEDSAQSLGENIYQVRMHIKVLIKSIYAVGERNTASEFSEGVIPGEGLGPFYKRL